LRQNGDDAVWTLSTDHNTWSVSAQARVDANGSAVLEDISGTYDSVQTWPSDCTGSVHTTGTVTGGFFAGTSDPSVILLTLIARFVSVPSDCNGSGPPSESGPLQSSSLVGRPIYQDGRLVEIDFTYSDSFVFGGGSSSYVQTGSLR
jgi:hypothetical protein